MPPAKTMQGDREYITFKEYVDTRLAALDKATEIAHKAMQERLAGMNEFREQLKDQASKFVTRNEMEIAIDRLCEDVKSLRESRAALEGKASASSVYIAYAIAAIGIILSVIGLMMR